MAVILSCSGGVAGEVEGRRPLQPERAQQSELRGGRLGNGHITGQASKCLALAYPSGLKVKNPLSGHPPKSRGKRDRIYGFSKGASRRMREYLASIDWRSHSGHFVSLTYHYAPTSLETAKEHLGTFRRRLFREYEGSLLGVIWKQEFQERGVVHFHLVLFWKMFPISDADLWMWIARNWYDIVLGVDPDEDPRVDRAFVSYGTDVRPLDTSNIARFMRYCSKYLTKTGRMVMPNTGEVVPTGRIWGHWGDVECLIWARMVFPRETLVDLARRVRRWGKASRYQSKISGKWSGFLLWGDGWQLCSLFRGLEYSISPG